MMNLYAFIIVNAYNYMDIFLYIILYMEGKVTKYHIFALRHVLEINCSLKQKNELNSYR
ncbi:hypothetical protein EMIT079MI2_420032 [Bacillus sp. IT-79MI2]